MSTLNLHILKLYAKMSTKSITYSFGNCLARETMLNMGVVSFFRKLDGMPDTLGP